MPGTSRSISAKDQVRDGSVGLVPPSEDRFCCSTKVCVWTLKSIKQKSHRAVGSSLQAFRQILQILKRGRSHNQNTCPARQQMACYSRISSQWFWCSTKLIYQHTDPVIVCTSLKAHSVHVLWKFKSGYQLSYTPRMLYCDVILFLFTQTWSKMETSGASSSFLWRMGWGWTEPLLK